MEGKGEDGMRRRLRGLMASILLLMLLAPGGRAEFSPGFLDMEKDGVTATLQCSLSKLQNAGEDSLAVLNDWLSRVAFLSAVRDQDARTEITLDGKTAFLAQTHRGPQYTLTAFGPEGGAYITAPDQKNALELMLGESPLSLSPAPFMQAYPAFAQALYGTLGKYAAPKLAKERTSIRNAAASAAYETYLFKKGELTADIWQEALDAALPAVREAAEEYPGAYAQLEETLRALGFSGECRFKRFLNADGQDMGMQLTCQTGIGGDMKSATLYFGFTPGMGGYFSLKRGDLRLVLEYRETAEKRVRTLYFAWEHQTAEKTFKGSVNLRNAVGEDQEAWSGKIEIRQTENKAQTVWTLTPALTLDEAGLHGTVKASRTEKNKETLKGEITLTVRRGAETDAPAAPAARDLREMDGEQAKAAVQGELIPLTGVIARLIKTAPEETRDHLLHDLRTDAWMNGPAAALTEDTDSWIVKEDRNP